MSVIIRLQNLPLSAGPSDVRAFFTGLKIPSGAVHIIGGPDGDVFIGFASDEDARQAMRKDRMHIHGAEIKLFLSSKTEMVNVIDQANSGTMAQSEPEPEQPKAWQPTTQPTERAPNPYAARPGYTASYPSTNTDYNAPEYTRTSPSNPSEQEKASPIERNQGGYVSNNQRSNVSRFSRPTNDMRNYRSGPENTHENKPPLKAPVFATTQPMIRQPNNVSQNQYRQAYDIKLSNDSSNLLDRREESKSDSWRDSSYTRSDSSVSRNGPIIHNNDQRFNNGRKTLLGNGILQGPNTGNMRSSPMIQQQQPYIKPKSLMPTSDEKFYIEMTRLPIDLLRPAGLEDFIRPSIPLTLSSAKCVFGPGGVHIHTLVRLDSFADFEMMLKRDGEQGIKIRRTTKNDFDSAIEGIPVANSSSIDDRRRRKSRSPRRRSPRRRDDNMRRSPDRTRRSRSPMRKRRRSMSPDRDNRKNHSDPTRWCLQVTNVPFRIKDEELLEWFSEKVKPAKLTRTFYADGNASDRWVAEFASESLMERAFAIRNLCNGRTIRLCYITNEKADEMIKIEDRYGFEKKHKSEEIRGEVDKMNPMTFFNNAPISKTTPIVTGNGVMAPQFPPPPIIANRGVSYPTRGMIGGGRAMYTQPPPPIHSTFFMSGQGPSTNTPNNYRGGSFRGRGAFIPRGSFHNNNNNNNINNRTNPIITNEDEAKAKMNFFNSIGPKGTVLTSTGLPKETTLEDVMELFSEFDPIRHTIRIRRSSDSNTLECLLACSSSEKAASAVEKLNNSTYRNGNIQIIIANP